MTMLLAPLLLLPSLPSLVSFGCPAEKDQLHLDYAQRVELLALFKQVNLGAYSSDKDTDTGYFDVIGSDRRCLHI